MREAYPVDHCRALDRGSQRNREQPSSGRSLASLAAAVAGQPAAAAAAAGGEPGQVQRADSAGPLLGRRISLRLGGDGPPRVPSEPSLQRLQRLLQGGASPNRRGRPKAQRGAPDADHGRRIVWRVSHSNSRLLDERDGQRYHTVRVGGGGSHQPANHLHQLAGAGAAALHRGDGGAARAASHRSALTAASLARLAAAAESLASRSATASPSASSAASAAASEPSAESAVTALVALSASGAAAGAAVGAAAAAHAARPAEPAQHDPGGGP